MVCLCYVIFLLNADKFYKLFLSNHDNSRSGTAFYNLYFIIKFLKLHNIYHWMKFGSKLSLHHKGLDRAHAFLRLRFFYLSFILFLKKRHLVAVFISVINTGELNVSRCFLSFTTLKEISFNIF